MGGRAVNDLVLGLVTGFLFSFLLQKGRVLRFDKQVGAMRLRDMTILKFMLSAIGVGMFGLVALQQWGVIAYSHKAMNLGALLVGGALFGAGWAVMGFCPGTAVGALGEGRWHAGFAIIGMLVGAALYAEAYPLMKSTVLAWKDCGKFGLPDALGQPSWLVASVLAAVYGGLFVFFERWKL
jgi:hypothetical protein